MVELLVIISTLTPLILSVSLLLIPLRPVGGADFALWALACIVLLLAVSDLTRWDFAGGWFKWFSLAAAVVFAVVRWQLVGTSTDAILPSMRTVWSSLGCLGLAGALIFTIHRRPAGELFDLGMPLRESVWYVAHGGSSMLTNHHHSVPAQRYAVDLTVLGDMGRRARSLRPQVLDSYAAFGQRVVAPCDGVVVAAETLRVDLPIGARDPSNPAGNFVAIQCDSVTVVLAHLQAGSVALLPGATVTKGELIGRIGNSGNSSEPHLHVHAVRGRESELGELFFQGRGVPLSFDGRFLVRGDTR